jgi:hypothetical protein
VTRANECSQRRISAKYDEKRKRPAQGGLNTGSNVSNVVLFFGRATVEAQMNNNHSYYHL